ncbi:MAG: class I SAM-dependent methyltransferase [Candidatus Diapherotrites archaeon]|nr:class I SAM-dependent methyltransferase [Candidatus Diapherotrites archaeon]
MEKTQRIFWNEYYRKHGEVWRGVAEIGEKLEGKRVLELGCGTGKTLKAILARKPKKVVAVDFSEIAIRIAAEKFLKEKNLSIVHADCTDLPFESKSFDIIFCHHVLGAMKLKERKKCVSEMRRILVDNGIVIFEDFSSGDLRESGKEIEEKTPQKKNGIIQHFFIKKEVKGLFSGAGFRRVSVRKKLKRLRLGKETVVRSEITARAVK